jgi:hypothetical protein
MDDLLDIPETEDFVTADTATTPLDAAPPDAPLDNTVDITGVKDEELQEAYAKLGHEIVEWSTNNKIQRINERQFRLLEKIGRKFSKFLLEGGAYGHMNHPFDMELDLTFGDLKNIITKALKGDLELTREKCIAGDSVIQTKNNGNIPISEFVDNKLTDLVLSFNEVTGNNEFMDVMVSFNNDDTDEWLEIEVEDGKTIQVTPNHRMYVDGIGYVQAKDLTEDMELKTL